MTKRGTSRQTPLRSSSARYAPLPSPFLVSFFHKAVCHVSKLRHKQRCPPGHLSSAMLVGLSLSRKRQRLEFSPACPVILIRSVRRPCSCQPLHVSLQLLLPSFLSLTDRWLWGSDTALRHSAQKPATASTSSVQRSNSN